jgi:Spy/CpxP family protein refolding chaperone
MQSIRNGWQVIAASIAVFVLGVLAGAFSLHLYGSRHRGAGEQHGPQIKRIIDNLNLNADQKAQVEVIFNDTRNRLRDIKRESQPKYDEVRRNGRAQLQKVLTPEQWKQLEEQEKMEVKKEGGGDKR